MAEYIEREAAKEELVSWARCINYPKYLLTEDAMCVLDGMKAADVVEVVRCKDCKYYTTEDFDGDILCGCKVYCAMLDITPDGFCSYGERKDGAT